MTDPAALPPAASFAQTLAFDVAVVGAGPAGSLLALLLAEAGLRVGLLERRPPAVPAPSDSRTTALAEGARRLFAALHLWDELAPHAQPITHIRINDDGAPVALDFAASDVEAEAFGWITPNDAIARALAGRVGAHPGIQMLAPAEIVGFEAGAERASLTLADGREVLARLVAAADGKQSTLRQLAGIKAVTRDYGETALVAVCALGKPHRGIALERFTPNGPFALLPMTDGADGRPRAQIVWTERDARAEERLRLPRWAIEAELLRLAGAWTGGVVPLTGLELWPLQLVQALRLTGPRLALVGDAAHAIHPVAGQGLNLGLRDVAWLAELVADAARGGGDPGAPGLLRRYALRRWPDILAMAGATDGLERLFGNHLPLVTPLRRLGLAATQRVPAAKRLFIRTAMGTGGTLRSLPQVMRERSSLSS